MIKKRLSSKQYRDETIRRQIQVTRYVTGQANYVNSMINKLNESIARYCIKKDLIETKLQYKECKKYVRVKCIEYRDRLYNYLHKELSGFIIEQAKWIYTNSPIKLDTIDTSKIINDAFFTAFSDTDNIKSYISRIFDQIFQTWNAQLTISYRIQQRMKDMVKLVLGREIK